MTEQDIDDLSDTIKPKSDQLNSDDLLTGPITVTIANVTRGTPDQPVSIEIGEGRQPYKPCKSMRRVMISAWGVRGKDWIGKSMTLYCDPTVKFGGVALGGIRISHMSHISGPLSIMLTTTRSKRAPFNVLPLKAEEPKAYPDALFKKNLPTWTAYIKDGKMAAKDVIGKAAERAPLTDQQVTAILSIGEPEAS